MALIPISTGLGSRSLDKYESSFTAIYVLTCEDLYDITKDCDVPSSVACQGYFNGEFWAKISGGGPTVRINQYGNTV